MRLQKVCYVKAAQGRTVAERSPVTLTFHRQDTSSRRHVSEYKTVEKTV